MSTIDGLNRRIDTLQEDLGHIPQLQERSILLLPFKDHLDGDPCQGDGCPCGVKQVRDTAYSRTIFYNSTAPVAEIERLIHD
jgi:hypothetical protein